MMLFPTPHQWTLAHSWLLGKKAMSRSIEYDERTASAWIIELDYRASRRFNTTA
jgi:hypothetical protein